MSDFDRKLRFFAKQLGWMFVCILVGFFGSWGIYTGVQYMNDECVTKTKTGIALDYWLITACVYDMVFCIIVWLLLCCHAKGCIRRLVIWPIHLGNLVWTGIGIWLVVESNIRCQHNSLWVVSMVLIILTGLTAVSLFVVWLLNRIGLCRVVGSYISIEETPYEDYLVGMRQTAPTTNENILPYFYTPVAAGTAPGQ